jgi:hypothetical protein
MVAPGIPCSLVLEETAIIIAGSHIDAYAPNATARLCELGGPELQTTPAGLKGVGRTAHWLASGLVVVSEDSANDALTMVFVCFDEVDASPYPQWVTSLTPFRGSVQWGERYFSGGDAEDTILQIPGMGGHGGMHHVRAGSLFLLFSLKKRRSPTGQRIGRRRLVQICAQWLRAKPESEEPASVGDPWAD